MCSLFFTYYSYARSWEKVVSGGFGDPWNDYAWSMVTFKGKLYVGTLNFFSGAEIWWSGTGEKETWERVYKCRVGGNSGVRGLYADGNQAIYGCTTNRSGAQILRSTDGKNWVVVVRRGLRDIRNTTIRCMTRFGEYLYAGVGGNRAKLIRSRDGLEWAEVNDEPSIDSTVVIDPDTGRSANNNVMVGELAVFNHYLYAFTWTKDVDFRGMSRFLNEVANRQLASGDKNQENIYKNVSSGLRREDVEDTPSFRSAPGAFEVWRSPDGEKWEKVVGLNDPYGNGLGFSGHDPDNMDNDVITSVTVFKGMLYLGTEHDYAKTSIWRTSEGTGWEKVLDFYDIGEKQNYYVWRMTPFRDKLFVGTLNAGTTVKPGVTGAQIWVSESGDMNTFYNIVHNGFDGEKVAFMPGVELPKNYGIRSFSIINDTLFAGTAVPLGAHPRLFDGDEDIIDGIVNERGSGCEIWKMLE